MLYSYEEVKKGDREIIDTIKFICVYILKSMHIWNKSNKYASLTGSGYLLKLCFPINQKALAVNVK